MLEKWYIEIENKFPNALCHEMVVMPNHFHCIIELIKPEIEILAWDEYPAINNDNDPGDLENKKSAPINSIVQWFKTMTTNTYIDSVKKLDWPKFNRKLWQRNYYEHVIRNEASYLKISEYIHNNPFKWKEDKFYKIDNE